MKRETYLSLARVICALAVITIHTNICFSEFNIEKCWQVGNFIHGSMAFAVPVFLMISGATLMNYQKRYSTKAFFEKRILKTVVPYLLWTIIGIILSSIFHITPIHLVYVFFLYLFGVYLCIPVFSFIQEEYQDMIIKYVITVSFVLNFLIPFLYQIFPCKYEIKIPFDIANGYLIYALLGYLISKYEVPFKWRIISYVFAILGFVLRIGETYYYSICNGKLDETFRGYTNLTCLLSSVGVFILIKQIGRKIQNEKCIKVIEWLSGYTFSVYLIHYFLLKMIKDYFFVEYIHTIGYKLLIPIFVFSISIVIIWLLRKIPIVRKILP